MLEDIAIRLEAIAFMLEGLEVMLGHALCSSALRASQKSRMTWCLWKPHQSDCVSLGLVGLEFNKLLLTSSF